MKLKPMKHQEVSLMHDKTTPLVFDMSDPGTGKTFVRIAAFAARRRKGGGAMLVLCPRSLMYSAWAADFAKFAPDMRVSVAPAASREEAFARQADVYIVNHDGAKWLASQPASFFDRFQNGELVVDECFPAGTPVDTPTGPRPIEELRVGDVVWTSAGALPVTSTFVSESKVLVRLDLDDGTAFYCTPNHPIATDQGWCPAGQALSLFAVRLDVREHAQPQADLLFSQLQQKSDVAQCSAQGESCVHRQDGELSQRETILEFGDSLSARDKGSSEPHSSTKRPPSADTWRQWKDCSVRGAGCRDAAEDLDDELLDPNWSGSGIGLSINLQSGLCERATAQGIGDRRQFAQVAQTLGCQEDRFIALSRVVGVTYLERAGTYRVFNLQVDGPHDYSVHGTLVHNCTAYKHHTSQRSRAALKLRTMTIARQPVFAHVALLSATPASNGICDVWHQVFLLDRGRRLGSSFYAFRDHVCKPTQVGRNANAIRWEDKPGAEEAVFGLINDLVIRHRFEDCVDIPATHYYTVSYQMSKKQRRAYDDMAQAQLLVLRGKGKTPPKLTAINAAAVSTKLLQIASGAVYDNDGNYHVIETDRYELLMDLAEARRHPIVFYFWKHQKAALAAEATKRGMTFAIYDGDVGDRDRYAIEQRYQAGQLDVLLAHPKSVAHGLTLTAGTSIIWSGPTADLEWWLQGNRRQARIGQTRKTEVICVLAEDTHDEHVYHNILQPKDGRQKTLLELFAGEFKQAA